MNLICTFTDNQSLTYELRHIPIIDRFAPVIKKCNQLGYKPGYISMGLYHTVDDLEYLTNILRNCIQKHNSCSRVSQRIYFDESLCDEPTANNLNCLHDTYEQNMSQHEGAVSVVGEYNPTRDYVVNLNRINNVIHMVEKNLFSIQSEFHEGIITSCLVNGTGRGDTGRKVMKAGGDVLTEEDRQEFTLGRDFGDLCLGYSTTGKNLIQCFWSKDLQLIKDRKLSPQKVFNTNILMQFPLEIRDHDAEYGYFKKWYDENNISQYGYTADVATEGIGYIKIGHLIRHNNNYINPRELDKEERLDIINKIKRCTLLKYDVEEVKVPYRHYKEDQFTEKNRFGRRLITTKKYDVHVSESISQLEQLLEFREGDTILDIGSGFGDAARELSKKYSSEVYCCDVNSYFLYKAKQNCADVPNMHFNLVDDDERPLKFLEDNSIDKAYAYAVFIHNETPTIIRYLRELKRVLKDSGRVYFTYCNRKLSKRVGNDVLESDKIAIDGVISELGFNFLKNATTINTLEGQTHADPHSVWEAVITTTTIQK